MRPIPERRLHGFTFSDLIVFAQRYFQDRREKLVAVLVLDVLLTSINGVGLLLIVPLLHLLGFGGASEEHPLWRSLNAALSRLGWTLNLESGLLLFVAIVSGHALLNWRRATWKVDVEQGFQATLRNQLYRALARTELSCLQQMRTSEFVQSTQSEIRRAQQAADVLLQLFSQALNLIAYFIVALILSLEMTLVALGCGVVGALGMMPLVRKTHALSLQEMRIRSYMVNNLLEHIQGLRVARSLGLTGRFVEDYEALSARAAHINILITRLSAKSMLVFEQVAVLVLAGLVYVGLTQFDLDAARFLVVLLVFVRLFPAVGKLNSQAQLFVSLLPGFRYYLDLLTELERNQEVLAPSGDTPQLRMHHGLELRAVSFRYHPNDEWLLRDTSLAIPKGMVTALAGHSGAGKSTLVDIVTGALPPGGGHLCLDGRPLDDTDRVLWRKETAMVPQDSFLFNDTIRGNLLCVKPTATEQELWDVLDAVNARAFVELRRDGIDSSVGERGNLLSGGERQRLSIARALLRGPQLLVLDEPTNNLDTDSVSALINALETLKRQATLLIVSHDPRILRRADRVFRVEGGSVVA
jgi:ATP-binding cassette subfamily C protein